MPEVTQTLEDLKHLGYGIRTSGLDIPIRGTQLELFYIPSSNTVYQSPISYDLPLGLWIGRGTGLVMFHSYHTVFLLVSRQKLTSTVCPFWSCTGVLRRRKQAPYIIKSYQKVLALKVWNEVHFTIYLSITQNSDTNRVIEPQKALPLAVKILIESHPV